MDDLEVALRDIARCEVEAAHLQKALDTDCSKNIKWGMPLRVSAQSGARTIAKIADLRLRAETQRRWVRRFCKANGVEDPFHSPVAASKRKAGRKRWGPVKRLPVAHPDRSRFINAGLTDKQIEVAVIYYADRQVPLAAMARELGITTKSVSNRLDAVVQKMSNLETVSRERRRSGGPRQPRGPARWA